ncbi:type II toxin-antitoxin system PemK/MazF family toxin [candidate division KSB1 bacterium]|nr:type II toxin-antitoxin system PemK/MazF family toxin [candidate division KSB1 bacterium]
MVGVKRGEIWLDDWSPTKGSEQMGTRPCLIVSNDVTNEFGATVCVLPLTSNLAGSRFPINVILRSEDSGLKVDSLVLGGQIRTVAKERLLRKLSEIQVAKMPDIETALKTYIDIRS